MRNQERQARATIYRRAAELLDSRTCWTMFSCHAIYMAIHGDLPTNRMFNGSDTPEIVTYAEFFKPENAGVLWFEGFSHADEEVCKQRGIMLDMMAAMIEAGDA